MTLSVPPLRFAASTSSATARSRLFAPEAIWRDLNRPSTMPDKSVRAQDVDVTALDLVAANIDLHGLAHAERARDDVLVGEVALFLFRHVGLRFFVVFEQRVIARELRDARCRARDRPANHRRGRRRSCRRTDQRR